MTVCVWIFPKAYFLTRVFLIISLSGLWLYGIFLLRKLPVSAVSLLSAGLAIIVFLILPGSEPDQVRLRKEYISVLKRYEGTVYIWGGENKIGIDCSGLVRNGLIDANVLVGIKTLNPKPIRTALNMWWNDCSASALRDGYRNYTKTLFKAENINSANIDAMLPGDIAVTVDGVHVLAYLGENLWIEADPGVMRVILVKTPTNNPWFTVPVYILRWTQLI